MLTAWAAGVAGASAMVVRWAIVGAGFTRLGLGVALLLAIPGAIAGGGVAAWLGCAAAAIGVAMAGRRIVALVAAGLAALALLIAGATDAPFALAMSAAVVLGGVTGEMLLGHWYLVDPTLPRSALRALGRLGLAGLVIDAVAMLAHGAVPWPAQDAVSGVGWVMLTCLGMLLMTAVLLALREPGYPAVMAATGLSYLAVLTTIATVVLGRVLVSGVSLG